MTTRYEHSDGMDDKISFGEQIVKPSEEEIKKVFLYVVQNNPNLKLPEDEDFYYPDSLETASREEIKELLLYAMDNNEKVSLPLQGMVTVSRLRKEV